MIKKIIISIKDRTFFKKVNHKIKVNVFRIFRKFLDKKIKIKDNKIMFITFQGDYNCNPKAIANELIKQNLPYELIWVVRKENLKNKENYPKELKLVVRGSLKFYIEAAASKIIIDNANNFEYLKMHKKEGQFLLQPWHGSMGFKRLDPASVQNEKWVKKALMLDDVTDYCIVNSAFEIDVFKNSYWPTTPMLKYGHPRNDILFNKNNEFEIYSKKIRKMYNIADDIKICLYAPTHRDNSTLETYNIDFSKLEKALTERFGGKWCIFLRLHFKLRNVTIPSKYLQKVINVTDYPDMQELLCACDVGITDYSSWMCDYILTRRPGFLFTLDIDKYIDERGFYYPLETSPFPVAKTNDELYEKIIKFDDKKYQKEINKFLKEKDCYEDGNASKRVVKKINTITKIKDK